MNHGGDWIGYKTEYGRIPLDFSANISPLGLPDGVRMAAVRALDEADRYPDPLCRSLRNKLSEVHVIPADRIACGNGAADLIYRLCWMLQPHLALLTEPDFSEYENALRSIGCEIRRLQRKEKEGFLLPAESLAEAAGECDLIFLSNPNNPTGLLTERENLISLLHACREAGTTIVIDECFLDFADTPEQYTMVDCLLQWPELIILKAFTKTYAMAGLRLGYALCGNRDTAEKLQTSGQPWAVSHVAQKAGAAALNETDYVRRLRKMISEQRPRMITALSNLGVEVIQGRANYLLFRCSDPELGEKLRREGILIRECRNVPGLAAGWFRVAIRTEEENSRLLAAMKGVL